MAYEPALTSFILAGTVGGLALVMSLSADWEVTHELARATRGWTAVMLSRSYDRNDAGSQRRASREAAILLAHGYERMTDPHDPAVPDAEDASLSRGGGGPPEPVPEGPFVIRYRLVSFPV